VLGLGPALVFAAPRRAVCLDRERCVLSFREDRSASRAGWGLSTPQIFQTRTLPTAGSEGFAGPPKVSAERAKASAGAAETPLESCKVPLKPRKVPLAVRKLR